MHPLTERAITYLNGIGLETGNPRPWPDESSVPYFLRDAFELELVEIMGRTVLLAIADDQRHTPAVLESLTNRLQSASNAEVVYTTAGLTATDRKRLIERGISFLVPDFQLFLPARGVVDLRENYQAEQPAVVQHLSPSTQAMLLAALLRPSECGRTGDADPLMYPGWTREWVPAEVARSLGYSPMTATRAVRELVAAGIVEQFKPKRGHQVITMVDGHRASWERALPLLRSPVMRTVWVRDALWVRDLLAMRRMRVAGESALSKMSDLAEPRTKVVAIDSNGWTSANVQRYEKTPAGSGEYEVQIWRYDPRIHRKAKTVDPLSLYLSLQDNPDERVQGALEQMMEALPW